MSYRVLFYFLCLQSLAEAGIWKESFNFHLDGVLFKKNSLHLDFSRNAQVEAEKFPDVVYVDSQERKVQHDNVGNLFFEDISLHSSLSIPTNKENIALASLEVIFKDGAGAFASSFHNLEDVTGGRIKKTTRFFSSKNNHLSALAYERLKQKKGYSLASKPSSFGTDNFQIYHKSAHSEDKIFYLLKRDYKSIIKELWDTRGGSERKIRAVILHVHSRFDMCGRCAYSLDWELKEGFGKDILDFCGELNINKRLLIDVSAFVSSRQEYLVWGPGRRTLPVPPLLKNPSLTRDQLRAEYNRVIDFSEDLSGPKTFAQLVMPLFI